MGVALAAACTLALQVVLTRLFSAALLYHFSFLIISLALLGVGAGALLIYVRPRWFERPAVEPLLARWSTAFAVLLVVVPGVLVRLPYGPGYDATRGLRVLLPVVSALSALPFLAAGIVIALAIRRYVHAVGRVYAADLAGAGIGAVVVVPLMWVLDAPAIVVGLGAVAALAALLFADRGPSRRLAGGIGAGAVALAILAQTTSLYYLPPARYWSSAKPAADRWGALSRVVGYGPGGHFGPIVNYDRDGFPYLVYHRGRPSPGWRALGLGPQSIGFALIHPGRVLVIGGGGGRDIHNALSSNQRLVDVIELNRTIVRVVDHDLARWTGSPYSLPRSIRRSGTDARRWAPRARATTRSTSASPTRSAATRGPPTR